MREIDDYTFVGPLNFNRKEKTVTTVTRAQLSLTTKEFDALYLLATQEGEAVSFEALHGILQMPGAHRAATEKSLKHIISQVNESAAGFVRVGGHTEIGYTLHARWGHNWKNTPAATTTDFSHLHLPHLTEPKSWYKRARKTLYTGAAILAASAALFVILIQTAPGTEPSAEPSFVQAAEPVELVDIYDFEVPLAPLPPPPTPPPECEHEEECNCEEEET